jgi:hypothetical protein
MIEVPQPRVHVKTMIGRLEGNRGTGEYAGGGGCNNYRDVYVEGEGRGRSVALLSVNSVYDWTNRRHRLKFVGNGTYHFFYNLRDWDGNVARNKVLTHLLWYSKHFLAKEMWIAYICQRHRSFIWYEEWHTEQARAYSRRLLGKLIWFCFWQSIATGYGNVFCTAVQKYCHVTAHRIN